MSTELERLRVENEKLRTLWNHREEHLWKLADMVEAQRTGKSPILFVEADLRRLLSENEQLKAQIKNAAAKGESA